MIKINFIHYGWNICVFLLSDHNCYGKHFRSDICACWIITEVVEILLQCDFFLLKLILERKFLKFWTIWIVARRKKCLASFCPVFLQLTFRPIQEVPTIEFSLLQYWLKPRILFILICVLLLLIHILLSSCSTYSNSYFSSLFNFQQCLI